MLALSKFLGEFIGLFAVIVALAMMLRKTYWLAAIDGLLGNPGLLMVTAVFTVMFGLWLVLAHNIWSGPPPTIAVTVLAWGSLAKGVSLLVLSGPAMARVYRGFGLAPLYHFYLAVLLALGAWLTYASFTG
jgi:hypothetical protein